MSDDIKVGGLVVLRSGGPVMTVMRVVDRRGLLTVVWFDGETKMMDQFAVAEVVVVS